MPINRHPIALLFLTSLSFPFATYSLSLSLSTVRGWVSTTPSLPLLTVPGGGEEHHHRHTTLAGAIAGTQLGPAEYTTRRHHNTSEADVPPPPPPVSLHTTTVDLKLPKNEEGRCHHHHQVLHRFPLPGFAGQGQPVRNSIEKKYVQKSTICLM